jgi:arginyl-tRNA synthetase
MFYSELETRLEVAIVNAMQIAFGKSPSAMEISLQETRKEFDGDLTLVVFPFLKMSGKNPEETAKIIGEELVKNEEMVSAFNVVKGFLNISLSDAAISGLFNTQSQDAALGLRPAFDARNIMVEYSSPNTNKPLHLGHIRNNLLGYSVAEILKANGHQVFKVNLVNDRGIHICKSMLAWQKFGDGESPESSGLKGDHLVGKYYVIFDKEYKKQINELTAAGKSKEEAEKSAPLIVEAQEMLRKWEAGDPDVKALWEKMNTWVYDGFAITYKALGVDFDKIYYESDTYLLGKNLVQEGLDKKVLFKKDDGSVWIDLEADGLDQKVLLRSDGTSVYMTQDLGTAVSRHAEFNFKELIYVVGNEQDYHFKVLQKILERMGYDWAQHLAHLSYGMVELPEGKMKSREGTVVDADELISEMIKTAGELTRDLGKIEGLDETEAEELYRKLGLAALKYFILKVDPKKKMLFNPAESIDFTGNTGPFIQYTYTRIRSVLRKAGKAEFSSVPENISDSERKLIKILAIFPLTVRQAGENLSPAVIANYMYELAREYNSFYHEIPILREEDEKKRAFRLSLSKLSADVVEKGMSLLGIEVPERM